MEQANGQFEAMVRRHDQDLYHGDQRAPGLTTRMEGIEVRVKDQEAKQVTIARMFWAIILMLISILTTVVVKHG